MIYVSAVPHEEIRNMWLPLFRYVSMAAQHSNGRYEPEDIYDYAMSSSSTTWIAFDDEGIKGFTITRIWDYPRKRCLDMVFIAGEDGANWKDPMLRTLRTWAKDNNCEAIESTGRKGFERALRADGYKLLGQLYELPVDSPDIGDGDGWQQ